MYVYLLPLTINNTTEIADDAVQSVHTYEAAVKLQLGGIENLHVVFD